ncbi:MAG: SURF1 family protein [Beijerinckiaceae bacterium]
MQVKPTGRGLLWPAVFTLVVGAMLVSLGVWQLHRLAWKEALIAEIAARADAAPVPLPPEALWPLLEPENYGYRHVEVTGYYEHDKEALVFRAGGPNGMGPGYLVLTPLRLDTGAHVIVNRGFVAQDRKDPAQRAAGQIEGEIHVRGLMRPPEPRDFFTPADSPEKGTYFTRDPALIAAHFGLVRPAPFSLDADDLAVPGGWPKGGATVRIMPNNHLGYAITWFGLAAALVGVFVALVVRRSKALRN